MLVTIDHLGKTYAGTNPVVALNDVNLTLDSGEFLAVRGPSGCGKSTLLLTVGGLLRPDHGVVTINGIDPYTLTSDERAAFRGRTVGFVFQQFHLVPYLNVLENILAPNLAVASDAKDVRQRAMSLVEEFGLADRMHHVPSELSSGERQRTALARAVLNKPGLLLADEPTGNLDHRNADVVLQHLVNYASSGGAVLLVTHDDRAVACAQRSVDMDAGAVQNPTTSVSH